MPEGQNVELAHKLTEQEHEQRRKSRWEEIVEIVEVTFLAIVAIATAWSGYQAARWDGKQAFQYGQATKDRFQADSASTMGGQSLIANQSIFTAWLQANEAGAAKLQAMFVRRFTPDYEAAFRLWLQTDPFSNPTAPPGPAYMPQYRNPQLEQAKRLNAAASTAFAQGTTARETADKYVRDTVLFASVLFLIAVAQRFKVRGVRMGANAVAFSLLAFTLLTLLQLPRL